MKRSTWLALTIPALLLAACGAPLPPGSTRTFANAAAITIPAGGATSGPADPYPSAIVVADLPSDVASVTVRLTGLSHTWPDDLDVLLVGPTGQHTLLLSDAGGATDIVSGTMTFDAEAANVVPDGGPLVSGTYRPSAYGDGDTFPVTAPVGPYVADLSVFDGTDPNGTWHLYVVDDSGVDVGVLAGGWSLMFYVD